MGDRLLVERETGRCDADGANARPVKSSRSARVSRAGRRSADDAYRPVVSWRISGHSGHHGSSCDPPIAHLFAVQSVRTDTDGRVSTPAGVVGEDVLRSLEVRLPARGVVYVHSVPLAVTPHVEWAIARVLGTPVRLEWAPQPAEPTTRRAECTWTGRPGTGAEFAAALRGWP